MKNLVSYIIIASFAFQSTQGLAANPTSAIQEANQAIATLNSDEKKLADLQAALEISNLKLKAATAEANKRGHKVDLSKLMNLGLVATAGISSITSFAVLFNRPGVIVSNTLAAKYAKMTKIGKGFGIVAAAAAIALFVELTVYSQSRVIYKYIANLESLTDAELEAEIKSLIAEINLTDRQINTLEAAKSAIRPPRHVGPEL